jgi:hypothetical protein
MTTQFDVTPFASTVPQPSKDVAAGPEMIGLLRQILDTQREQLNFLRALVSFHDAGSRWRAFLTRWKNDFPELADGCRETVPILERTYATMIAELADNLRQNDAGTLDNDFALQDFLDRYGMRLAQLGTVLNLVAPLAEAGPQAESQQ